jgi:hypothetical protein
MQPGSDRPTGRPQRWSDHVAVRLTFFAIALAAAFGVGAGLGAAIGPAAGTSSVPSHEGSHGD